MNERLKNDSPSVSVEIYIELKINRFWNIKISLHKDPLNINLFFKVKSVLRIGSAHNN